VAVARIYGPGEEKRTGSFSFGGGFSTIDQLVGFAELTQATFRSAELAGLYWRRVRSSDSREYGTQRKDFILVLTSRGFIDRPFSVSASYLQRGELLELAL